MGYNLTDTITIVGCNNDAPGKKVLQGKVFSKVNDSFYCRELLISSMEDGNKVINSFYILGYEVSREITIQCYTDYAKSTNDETVTLLEKIIKKYPMSYMFDGVKFLSEDKLISFTIKNARNITGPIVSALLLLCTIGYKKLLNEGIFYAIKNELDGYEFDTHFFSFVYVVSLLLDDVKFLRDIRDQRRFDLFMQFNDDLGYVNGPASYAAQYMLKTENRGLFLNLYNIVLEKLNEDAPELDSEDDEENYYNDNIVDNYVNNTDDWCLISHSIEDYIELWKKNRKNVGRC